MANNFISYAQKCLPIVEQKLKGESVSSFLDSNKFSFVGVKTVKVYVQSTTGIGNYDRSTGYAVGTITGNWVEKTLTQDKGISFNVDEMDNEEEMELALRVQMADLLENHVAPTVDAYTFSTIASTSGVQVASADIVRGTTDVADLIDTAILAVNEASGKKKRALVLSDRTYAALQKNIVRTITNDENGINKEIETYCGMRVYTINKDRFADSIVQYDAKTSGQTAGDYVLAAGAHYINFMIIPEGAVDKITKLAKYKVLDAEDNRTADAYTIKYRLYYDVFVDDAVKDTIYVHKAATAFDA